VRDADEIARLGERNAAGNEQADLVGAVAVAPVAAALAQVRRTQQTFRHRPIAVWVWGSRAAMSFR